MDVEGVTETVEQCLTGESGFVLKAVGFKIAAYGDLGEIYLRAPGGDVFRMVVSAMSAEEFENAGVEFE